MTGYTKLFGSILASSLWQESKETKILWITMLAAANKWGVVQAAVPGLAHMAMLSVSETEAALKTLESADPYSRTPDNEGRRIKKVAEGWQLLNHALYREKMSVDDRREYNRIKQAEFRAKTKGKTKSKSVSMTVNDSQSQSALSAHSDSEAKADTVPPLPPKGGEELELVSDLPVKAKGKGTSEELQAYAVEIGLPASDGASMFDHWTANGWKNGSSPSKDWKAGIRKWKGQGWLPSQKQQTNGHRPKHAAYNAEEATRGKTAEQIGIF